MTTSTTYDDLVANVEGAAEFADLLDALLTAGDWSDIVDDWRDTLTDHGIDLDDDYGVDREPIEVADQLINEGVLEVYGKARVTADTVDISEIVVVTGVGGPHIEFGIDYNGRVVARGYWGSDKVERVTRVDALGEHLVELLGGWDR